MITREDLEVIESHCDDRYVLKEDCNDKQRSHANKFANDDKRIEILSREASAIKKLVWIVATATVGQLVAMVFDLIKG